MLDQDQGGAFGGVMLGFRHNFQDAHVCTPEKEGGGVMWIPGPYPLDRTASLPLYSLLQRKESYARYARNIICKQVLLGVLVLVDDW